MICTKGGFFMELKQFVQSFLTFFSFGLFIVINVCIGVFGLIIGFITFQSSSVFGIHDFHYFHKVLFLLLVYMVSKFVVISLYYLLTNQLKQNHIYNIRNIKIQMTVVSVAMVAITLIHVIYKMIGYQVNTGMFEMNILGFAFFFLIVTNIKQMSKVQETIYGVILQILHVAMLVVSIIQITRGYIPVEFSSVSYIVVPLIFLLNVKSLYSVGSYAGIMAGFFYYIYIIANGGRTYYVVDSNLVLFSMYQHGLLLFSGLYMIKQQPIFRRDMLKILGFVLFVGVWAQLNRPETISFRLFIYELMDAEVLFMMTNSVSVGMKIMYYSSICIFVLLSCFVICLLSKRTCIYQLKEEHIV